jgi:hypothetical protein
MMDMALTAISRLLAVVGIFVLIILMLWAGLLFVNGLNHGFKDIPAVGLVLAISLLGSGVAKLWQKLGE